MLTINKLHKRIDQKSILEEISFEQEPGEILGLVGRNGAGKSTLLKSIASHYLLDGGQILIDQVSIDEDRRLRTQIFYLDEDHLFFKNLTLLQIGRFYQQAYPQFDENQMTTLLAQYRLPLKQNYRQLSKGMRGLFNIILAISSHARYILLDEPFDGLDVIIRKNVIRLLLDQVGEQQFSLLITSHNLAELEPLIDRTLILKDRTISHDYRLETPRQTARKLQLVLKTNEIPALVKEKGRLLNVSGRVMVVYFPDYTDEIAQELAALDPVLCEALPITLEDVFEANLINEQDYQVFV
ncbi:ABC transporter ATP-binding protein YtrB [Latilactobacillus sakei]|nr:ABC transporter ATP-binding protein YtrB [Latilactobacillus sakei]